MHDDWLVKVIMFLLLIVFYLSIRIFLITFIAITYSDLLNGV